MRVDVASSWFPQLVKCVEEEFSVGVRNGAGDVVYPCKEMCDSAKAVITWIALLETGDVVQLVVVMLSLVVGGLCS